MSNNRQLPKHTESRRITITLTPLQLDALDVINIRYSPWNRKLTVPLAKIVHAGIAFLSQKHHEDKTTS
jgi:hypothetical protein